MQEELQGLEIDFQFDGDTQHIDGNPVVVFGETYNGNIILRNNNRYQYLVLTVEPDDPDMKIHPLEHDKYVMPYETKLVSFEINTNRGRKRPFKMGVNIQGGFIL